MVYALTSQVLRGRATNVNLPESLTAEAETLNINVSRACEAGLAAPAKAAREKRWLEVNREAMDALTRL